MRLRSRTAIPVRSDPLARWHGLWEYETHRVPAGATILDAKYANGVAATFFAKRNLQTGTAGTAGR